MVVTIVTITPRYVLITQQSSSSVPAAAAAVLDYMYIDLSIPELYTYIEYVVGQS